MRAASDGDNLLSFFSWRSACRGECICSGALLWTVVSRAFCWGVSRVLAADAADAAANSAAYVAQASPAAPSGDSIESGRGLKSRRKPFVQLDPSCDPLCALAHRCRKGSVTVTAPCSPLSVAVQTSHQGAFSMRSPWYFDGGAASASTTNRPVTLGVSSP
jgi:hypothetical protein